MSAGYKACAECGACCSPHDPKAFENSRWLCFSHRTKGTETMSKDDKKEDVGPRNFGVFLASLEGGTFQEDISAGMQAAHLELGVMAERNAKAKGKVTIELEIVHHQNGTVDVTAGYKIALPKTKRERSTFWTTKDGNLSDKNPKQVGLPFREVNANSAAKDIAAPGRVVKEVGNG